MEWLSRYHGIIDFGIWYKSAVKDWRHTKRFRCVEATFFTKVSGKSTLWRILAWHKNMLLVFFRWIPSLRLTKFLKMDGWKTTFPLGWCPGRCYVSFREGDVETTQLFSRLQRKGSYTFRPSRPPKNWHVYTLSCNKNTTKSTWKHGQDRSPSRVYPTFTIGFCHAKDKIPHQPDHDAKMVVMVWLKQKKGGMIRVAGYGGCEERVGWWLVNIFFRSLIVDLKRSFFNWVAGEK